MKFLDCFLEDPLPGPDAGKYDHDGPAVWLVDSQPQLGCYKFGQVLPLFDLSREQLEELASIIVCKWGNPKADPEYNARWMHYDGKSNLFLFQIWKRDIA